MADETIQTDRVTVVRSRIARPLPGCPACGSADLDPVSDALAEEVNFLCRACDRCWHVELGAVSRVVPTTCMGCREQARCLEVYAAEH